MSFFVIYPSISLLTLWTWAKNRLARNAEKPNFSTANDCKFYRDVYVNSIQFQCIFFGFSFYECCSVFDIVVRLIEIAWTHFAYMISIWQKSFRQSKISPKFGKSRKTNNQKPHKRKICFHQSQTHSRNTFFRFVVQNPFLCLLYGNILW